MDLAGVDHYEDEDTSHPDDEEQQNGDGFGAGGFYSGLAHGDLEEIAWFHIIFSSTCFVLGALILFRMYQARNVLEIRARSVYLVMILGACLLADFALDVHVECAHLFGWPSSVFATHLVYFFTVFTIECCYISRVIRLGVSFSPRIKKAIPWIMSERLLVWTSLTIGGLSMLIPGYYYNSTGGSDDQVRYVLVELDVVWKCQVALVSIQLCLLPVVWMVDDLFRISWELAIIVMLGVIDLVTLRLSETSALTPGVRLYINSSNIGLLWTSSLFGMSVVDPVRRLTFNPMAKPVIISRRVYAKHRSRSINSGPSKSDMTDAPSRSVSNSQEDHHPDDSRTVPNSTGSAMKTKWSYDQMAAVPAVADAFRAFALRALCQESVMFLEEVAKFERGDYAIAQPVISQFAAFNVITKRFIADGSRDEINIGSRDKQKLIDIYKAGSTIFFSLADEERRLVFGDAFVEIRSMLETNLLHRFLHTDGFRCVEVETPRLPMAGSFHLDGESKDASGRTRSSV